MKRLLIKKIFFIVLFSFVLVHISLTLIQMKITFIGMGRNHEITVQKGREKIVLKQGIFDLNVVGLYKNNNADKTIFYFHGNGETLKNKTIMNYLESNFKEYNILTYDYPGYGESKGISSLNSIYQSSELFYNRIIEEHKIKPENIVLWGHSIGTAIATDLASKKEFGSLILVSPFTSRYAMSKHYIGFVPQRFALIPNSLLSIDKVKKIENNVLIIHGTDDKTTPYYMGQELFDASVSPNKQFITVKGGTHGAIVNKGKQLIKYYKAFLKAKSIKNPEITLK